MFELKFSFYKAIFYPTPFVGRSPTFVFELPCWSGQESAALFSYQNKDFVEIRAF
jgi:hypothetical protein